MNASKAFLI